ncbi:hypothetical protein ALQ16_204939 [Pseudomonas syringae pv. actinidiae]|nr:hypothetical protein ALQ16_204939 [Pseudomonas syringae pv. actinidiae]
MRAAISSGAASGGKPRFLSNWVRRAEPGNAICSRNVVATSSKAAN